jgi:hypothetical protein
MSELRRSFRAFTELIEDEYWRRAARDRVIWSILGL